MEEGGGSWKKLVECAAATEPSDRWAGLALVGNGRMA